MNATRVDVTVAMQTFVAASAKVGGAPVGAGGSVTVPAAGEAII